MKVVCIGSGNMWVKDNSACYLIDDKILVDVPNGTMKALSRLNISRKNIHDVFITHMHGDHYFDMPFYLLEKGQMEKSYANIYTYFGGKGKINKITKLAFPNSYGTIFASDIKYNTNDKVEVLGYKVTRVMVHHGKMYPCFGYIFEKNNIKFGFTGDASFTSNIEYMAKTCTHLVCDCTLVKGSDSHMGIDNIKYLAEKYPNTKFYTSHMGATIKDSFTDKPENVTILSDGMVMYDDGGF